MSKYDVIILMAGESSRFNYEFKPFIKLDDRTCIEHCMEYFLKYDREICNFYFVVTKEQEEKYNVKETLFSMFYMIKSGLNIVQLDNKTDGPFQSLQKTLEKIKRTSESNGIIVCDCDHKINILPIRTTIAECLYWCDCIIPTWNIKTDEETQKSWGKLIHNCKTLQIQKFCEKEIINENELNDSMEILGLIGCYYFSNKIIDKIIASTNYINISNFLSDNHKNIKNLHHVNIEEAEFFGTPKQIEENLKLRRKKCTIFCDIDGVLIKHSPHSTCVLKDNEIIESKQTVNKLEYWRNKGYKIILTTARHTKFKSEIIELLRELNIPYDDIITGLNSGPRYVINDIKPTNNFVHMAIGINLARNNGINNIDINDNESDIKIIKRLKGGSFSHTYLVKNTNTNHEFVRKIIFKESKHTEEHYQKLKRQVEDMKRFKYYYSDLVPTVINEKDTDYCYYYDMEYLENYKLLEDYDSEITTDVLVSLIKKMKTDIYCYKKKLDVNEQIRFMDNFMSEKIYPKLDKFILDSEIMEYMINSNAIIINYKPYFGLKYVINNILNSENSDIYMPKYLQPIHGDFTLENIMYNEITDDVKLIDMEGSRYVDAVEFDVGKLFQSLMSNYKEWSQLETFDLILQKNTTINKKKILLDQNILDKYASYNFNNKDNTIINNIIKIYSNILDKTEEESISCGIFYMCMYFIRFVQFRRKVSEEHANFAILMAIIWLNNLYYYNIKKI